MKAIIFGVNSQDGTYLKNILESKSIRVIGISRSDGNWQTGDVGDTKFVTELIKNTSPDYIFHFAANSTTKHEALFENNETIGTGTLNILEGVRLYSPHTKVFITGSGVQFKNDGKPIHETDAFEASSTYSISRIQSVYAARYFRSIGIKVYVGYLFHHESPLRKDRHVNQKIALAAKAISNGNAEVLELGNIDIRKEFAFSGDIVEAIWLLVNQDEVFEAVIGTGIAYSIKDWIELCFERAGIHWEKSIKYNNDSFSPYKVLVSNPETIFRLGWKPKNSIVDLADMVMKSI